MDNEITPIPEHKLYNVLNKVLFEDIERSEKNFNGFCSMFEQYKFEDGFNADTFKSLYQKAKENKSHHNRIDCIAYLMKCILSNPKLYETISVLYTGAI